MASRTFRTVILAISKVLNYSVQIITPIILVRILDRETYGEYKEFFVYAGIAGTFINFGIKDSVIYFVSKYTDSAKDYITSSALFKFISSILGVIIILLFKEYLLELFSVDYIIPLVLYLFFFQNLDFIEQYWLAVKRSDYILYYSLTKSIIRVLVVVITAYITRDLNTIFYLVILFECLRFLFSLIYFSKLGLLAKKIKLTGAKEQLSYIIPLGIGAIVFHINTDISKVIISAKLGAASLALYAIASQRIPLVNIIRSSIADVIFPDMASSIDADEKKALNLWKRANILYLFLMLPLFYIQFYYAETIIRVLFTADYLEAVVIFQIYLFYFLKQCFEMGTPIRAKNKNRFLLFGFIGSGILNIGLIYLLFDKYGFIGPAIAYVVSEILLAFYFGNRIIKLYKISISELFYWRKIIIIFAVFTISVLVFFIVSIFKLNMIVELILGSILYYAISISVFKLLKIEEVDSLMRKITNKIKLSW